MVTCQGSIRYWNYLEDYRPCASGLSAVNAIGTQLRDPVNRDCHDGVCMAVLNQYMDAAANLGRNAVSSKHQVQPEYGDEQADAGRNCRTCLARPNSQAQTRTGKYEFSLLQLTTSRTDWQPYPVDPYIPGPYIVQRPLPPSTSSPQYHLATKPQVKDIFV